MNSDIKANNFNLEEIRNQSQTELLEILDTLGGRKCIVLDNQISGLINHIVPEGSKVLKESGVHYIRDLRGELGDFISESGRDIPDHIVYFTRPILSQMKTIASQVLPAIRAGIRSSFHVYFVPHRTVVCEQLLEDEGVLNQVNIGEYNLGLLPFDTDLLSLEMDAVFKQCYVDGDPSSLNYIAAALHRLQTVTGTIPSVKTKGVAARKVLQKLLRLRKEETKNNSNISGSSGSGSMRQQLSYPNHPMSGDIDVMVIMDREVDLASPLLTPLTYEGLVDECLGIEYGVIKVDQSILGDEEIPPNIPGGGQSQDTTPTPLVKRSPGEKVSVVLSGVSVSDPIYADSKDMSIEKLGSFLQ
eukprot:gene1442-2776_t